MSDSSMVCTRSSTKWCTAGQDNRRTDQCVGTQRRRRTRQRAQGWRKGPVRRSARRGSPEPVRHTRPSRTCDLPCWWLASVADIPADGTRSCLLGLAAPSMRLEEMVSDPRQFSRACRPRRQHFQRVALLRHRQPALARVRQVSSDLPGCPPGITHGAWRLVARCRATTQGGLLTSALGRSGMASETGRPLPTQESSLAEN